MRPRSFFRVYRYNIIRRGHPELSTCDIGLSSFTPFLLPDRRFYALSKTSKPSCRSRYCLDSWRFELFCPPFLRGAATFYPRTKGSSFSRQRRSLLMGTYFPQNIRSRCLLRFFSFYMTCLTPRPFPRSLQPSFHLPASERRLFFLSPVSAKSRFGSCRPLPYTLDQPSWPAI